MPLEEHRQRWRDEVSSSECNHGALFYIVSTTSPSRLRPDEELAKRPMKVASLPPDPSHKGLDFEYPTIDLMRESCSVFARGLRVLYIDRGMQVRQCSRRAHRCIKTPGIQALHRKPFLMSRSAIPATKHRPLLEEAPKTGNLSHLSKPIGKVPPCELIRFRDFK